MWHDSTSQQTQQSIAPPPVPPQRSVRARSQASHRRLPSVSADVRSTDVRHSICTRSGVLTTARFCKHHDICCGGDFAEGGGRFARSDSSFFAAPTGTLQASTRTAPQPCVRACVRACMRACDGPYVCSHTRIHVCRLWCIVWRGRGKASGPEGEGRRRKKFGVSGRT